MRKYVQVVQLGEIEERAINSITVTDHYSENYRVTLFV